MKIYLSISEISSYIGLKSFNLIESFEKLWHKIGDDYYETLLELESRESKKFKTISNIEKLEYALGKDTKNIIKNSYTDIEEKKNLLNSKLNEIKKVDNPQIQEIKNIVSDIINKTNNNRIKLNQDDTNNLLDTKLAEAKSYLDEDNINIIKNTVIKIHNTEMDKNVKEELIEDTFNNINTNLHDQYKEEIKSIAMQTINTTYGIIEESTTLNIIETYNKIELDKRQNYNSKIVYYTKHAWALGGRMDAIDHKNQTIIEIKNRIYKLYNRILDYEMCQVQLYMWLINYSRVELIEKYRDQINRYNIDYDIKYVNITLKKIIKFICIYEDMFLNNIENKIKYLKFNNKDKESFIKKIYLNQSSSSCL